MKTRESVLLNVLLTAAYLSCVGAARLAQADVAVDVADDVAQPARIVVADARLRSAFLLRATGHDQQQQPRVEGLSDDAVVRQLQRHFDAVLEILQSNETRALDIAVARLAARAGAHLSTADRLAWRARLAIERQSNLHRLRAYQQRGLFPINQHDANRTVPVFVDNHDTACAVGHLMRESGWGPQVAAVQAGANLVYVTDVAAGPIVDWVATSGLTQEEAALIQPGYPIGPSEDAFGNTTTLLNPDAIEANGLSVGRFAAYGGFPEDPIQAELYLRHGDAVAFDSGGGESFSPIYDRWLNVSGGGLYIGGLVRHTTPQNPFGTATGRGRYVFEIAATNPRERIAGVSVVSNYVVSLQSFLYAHAGGDASATASIVASTPGGIPLGTGSLTFSDQHFFGGAGEYDDGRDVVSFPPQQRVKVEVEIATYDEYPVENFGEIVSLGHEFNVITVPEPATTAIMLTALGLVVGAAGLRKPRCLNPVV